MSDTPFVCPTCARAYPASERFCEDCGMPLVQGGDGGPEPSERRRRARKIRPEYSQGPLVKVGWAANQPEAELIETLLLEEGIPSLQRRAGGFDVPDFLAAGPRDILVPESGAEAAREALSPPRP
jgi:hypothetical protein